MLWLLLPYVFFRLLLRARKQPDYLRHIGERFGFYSVACGQAGHLAARSVGWGDTRFTKSCRTTAYFLSNHQILLTHTTPRVVMPVSSFMATA